MRLLLSLFSPPSGTWGGLTRILAIARAAERAGHEVAATASGQLRDDVERHGIRVYPMPEPTFLGLPRWISQRLAERSQERVPPVRAGRSFGSMWLVFWFTGLTNRRYMRRALGAELEAIEEFEPDLIFTDANLGAFLSSHVVGIPLACAYSSIIHVGRGSWAWRRVRDSVASLLAEHGRRPADFEEFMFGERVLKVIPSIPALDGSDGTRPDTVYVGHLIGEMGLGDEVEVHPERRIVFVYVGTGSVSLDRLYEVLPQVFPAGGEITCLVGSQSIRTKERIGAVEFHPFVPAETILPHCEWTICHGGQNTIIQSLLHGVPLILFPGPIFERRFNARQVEGASAGIMGELPEFEPGWLRAALAKRKRYATGAGELGAKLRSMGGPAAAVEAMNRFHRRRVAGSQSAHPSS